eukprot:766529-Hanusia_phi.AAC.4
MEPMEEVHGLAQARRSAFADNPAKLGHGGKGSRGGGGTPTIPRPLGIEQCNDRLAGVLQDLSIGQEVGIEILRFQFHGINDFIPQVFGQRRKSC